MNKLKTIFLIFITMPLFFIVSIYGYANTETEEKINEFSINKKTSYTVVHELMNLDGTTYTPIETLTYNEITIGETVTPDVLPPMEGFDVPPTQTVTLTTYDNTVITYQYPRKQFYLTINNSEYVETETPTGLYYYGQEIVLTASSTDNQGSPFLMWSNNNTNINYTFTLTEDTTIGPLYAESYEVTYEPNNHDHQITTRVIKNNSIGTFPEVIYNDCDAGTGSYLERNCTYVYEFQGWYKEPTFVNKVTEDFVPKSNITLYAKWNKIFFSKPGETIFDGTNYIDSEIKLFSKENADKDFIITFTVDTNNGYATDRGTIFTDMNEKADPWPGIHFFTIDNVNKYVMNVNIEGNKVKDENTGYHVGEKVVIKKDYGIIYYSYNDGPFIEINNFVNFTSYFNNNATFGAGTSSKGQPYRFFQGTLADMSIELKEAPSYKINYDGNGGTGTMLGQQVKINQTINLNPNSFVNSEYSFAGWNTEPDGSGTSYNNRESVTNIANNGETVTLYAQWGPLVHYSIHFDANGGEGTMPNQILAYNGVPQQLNPSEYTKFEHGFVNWNTEPDGSGISYEDEEFVVDLSETEGDIVTLYAQYMKVIYSIEGDTVFDGTEDTFIDTGINLYTEETIDKDFEIRFTVTETASNNTFQATIINCKDETNPKWPGFNIRMNKTTTMTPTYKWNNADQSKTLPEIATSNVPIEFVFRRKNGTVTLSYSYEGYQSPTHTLYKQSDWLLDQYFTDNISFGGIFNNESNPDRFFQGTLSDIVIMIED